MVHVLSKANIFRTSSNFSRYTGSSCTHFHDLYSPSGADTGFQEGVCLVSLLHTIRATRAYYVFLLNGWSFWMLFFFFKKILFALLSSWTFYVGNAYNWPPPPSIPSPSLRPQAAPRQPPLTPTPPHLTSPAPTPFTNHPGVQRTTSKILNPLPGHYLGPLVDRCGAIVIPIPETFQQRVTTPSPEILIS